MSSLFHRVLLSLAAPAVLVLAGCQSNNSAAPVAAAGPAPQAVSCSKCQVTWVSVPVEGGKGKIVGYSSRKTMICPDCKDAVANFFSTGKLQHTCKTCGDTMEACEAH